MSQIMMLGIGGLDADLLRAYGPSLPNLRRLMLESPFLELKSTIPPEPMPAWTSLYTGLNPANHGMLAKMDCLERIVHEEHACQVEPFWERVARAGKRVCAINPLLARPEQAIQGLLIMPSSGNVPAHAEGFPALLDEPLIPPASQLTAFSTSLQERTGQQVNAALQIFARERWDLFFVQLDALDYVQHFLWRYSDPGDPMYPGRNEHASRILDFYRLFDTIVGRFRAALPPECMLAVVSSHGHERRCIYRLHINEWLREQNLLIAEGQMPFRPNAAPARQRRGTPGTSLFAKIMDYLPWLNGRQRTGQCVDQQQSMACLDELSSATSSYGGIRLNRAEITRAQQDYEQVRASIIAGLGQICVKDSPVVNWAKRREECYHGKHLDAYPDILFELRSDFGVGRSLYGPLAIPDSTHRLVSGAHSANGVFLLENWPAELDVYEDFVEPAVMDIAPTILRLLGVDSSGLDGTSLVYPHPIRQLI